MKLVRVAEVVLLAGMLMAMQSALAAPEEIQVYMDEMDAPGQWGLDMHVNDVSSSGSNVLYPGQLPAAHLFRVTPEWSYGLTPYLELGAYWLTADSPANGGWQWLGEKARIKFIAPKAAGQTWFWGANLEVGKTSSLMDINPWNGELKLILGDRPGNWEFATNLNFDRALEGPDIQPTMVELDDRISYRVSPDWRIGAEAYNQLGSVNVPAPLADYSEMLYMVADTSWHHWDFNLGLGHGLTAVSDHWVAKMIIGVPLEDF